MRVLARFALVFALIMAGGSLTARAQSDAAVYVVTYLEAAPSSQQTVATALSRLAEASKADQATYFQALRSTTESNQFLLLETWKDQAALDAHRAAAHTVRFREQIAPLLLAPADERVCVGTLVAPSAQGPGAAYVVTHVDVPGTNRDSALVHLRAVTQRSRAEAGSRRFDVVHQRDRTNHFTMIEMWVDRASADAHQLAPHTREFRGAITPLLGALFDQRWYAPL